MDMRLCHNSFSAGHHLCNQYRRIECPGWKALFFLPIMVALGFYFLLFFALSLILACRGSIEHKKGFQRLALFTIPLAYLATMLGWTVAEVGRQPWVIQDLMPTFAAVSRIDANTVRITFWLFLLVFTALLIAEVKIMTKQIKIGPEEGGN